MEIDTSQVSLAVVTEISNLHSEISSAYRSSLEKAIRIGELLIQQKEKIAHGQWLKWVESNLPFSERSARNYMAVFSNRENLKTATVADLTTAYKYLAPPPTIEPAQGGYVPKSLIPPVGFATLGRRLDGTGETLLAVNQATSPGYYYYAIIRGEEVSGGLRPILPEYVSSALELEGIQVSDFLTIHTPKDPWNRNEWLHKGEVH